MKPDRESREHSWFKILRRKIMGSGYSDFFLQWKYEPNFEIGNVSKHLLIKVSVLFGKV